MIRHLTEAAFTRMPWANGKGQTVEMARADDEAGLRWRFSRAAVVEDGDFSLFPGIDRVLTVLSGPGFDLAGDRMIAARPLIPVFFPGDVPIRAINVTTPCEDFNVMVRRGTALHVRVLDGGTVPSGALFALGPVQAGPHVLARHDLVLTDEPLTFSGLAIAVSLPL